jgi:hypothetical protein
MPFRYVRTFYTNFLILKLIGSSALLSGGGKRFNTTSDNGGVPSRWMAYEAMLAGLEMSPFRKHLGNEDLAGRRPTSSMTRLYKILECVPLQWADDSVSPLVNTNSEAENRKFKRCGSLFFLPSFNY